MTPGPVSDVWREARDGFDDVADRYAEFRFAYPDRLVDDVLSFVRSSERANKPTIVEVGSGTGHATGQFLPHAGRITCIEPGAQLAAVARARFSDDPRATIVTCRFEDWSFDCVSDLLISATALHWVDADARVELAWRALGPGGTIAWFGHQLASNEHPLQQVLRDLIIAHADGETLASVQQLKHEQARQVDLLESQFRASTLFGDVQNFEYQSEQVLDSRGFLGLLGTLSSYRALGVEVHDAVRAVIPSEIAKLGGRVRLNFVSRLHIAPRHDGFPRG
jgi:trans-aconitate methyltransferase